MMYVNQMTNFHWASYT